MPPLQAVGWPRDPLWRAILARLVDEVARTPGTPAEAAEVCAALRRAVDEDPEALEDLAEAVLAEQDHGVDGAAAPFVMAALRVYWTSLASRFDEKQLPVTSPFGVCPVCASLPVASIVRVGGQFEGYRYLCCSLCSTQWHMVRVKCSHCGRGIGGLSGHRRPLRGHQGGDLRPLPQLSQDLLPGQDLHVEPVADDLASLMLDVLVGEAGYARASNPCCGTARRKNERRPVVRWRRPGRRRFRHSFARPAVERRRAAAGAGRPRPQVVAALRQDLDALRQRALGRPDARAPSWTRRPWRAAWTPRWPAPRRRACAPCTT